MDDGEEKEGQGVGLFCPLHTLPSLVPKIPSTLPDQRRLLSNLKPKSVEAQVAQWANDWVSNCCKSPYLPSRPLPSQTPPPHIYSSLSLQQGGGGG